MPLRSVLLFALLLAVSAAAQNATVGRWDDVLYSWIFNATPVKLCAIDAPTKCVNIIRLNVIVNPNKTIVVSIYPVLNVDVITEYSLLQVVTSTSTRTLSAVTVDLPMGGVLYAYSQFRVGNITSDYMRLCDSRYYHAVPVAAGRYTVKNINPPLYLMDNKTCISYKVIAPISLVANITTPYAHLAVFEMPSARKRVGLGFNGTQHLYNLQTIDAFLGRGFYLANGTQVPMIAVQKFAISHGPVHFSAIGMPQLFTTGGGFAYTIGWTPGDGMAVFWVYQQFNWGRAEVAFFGDGFGGYFAQEGAYIYANAWRQFVIYAPRYSLVDITVYDGIYLWNTRTLACGGYRGETVPTTSFASLPGGFLYRVDRAVEVEICNNSTYTYYAGAYYRRYTGSVEGYFMIDRVEPGACRRFRWDATPDYVYFFNSTADVCRFKPTFWFRGSSFTPGWRHYVTQDRKLIRDAPIDIDGMYLQLLNQTLQLLSSLYRNMTMSLLRWYKNARANESQALSLSQFVASQPRFLGTIKIDAATSTWLHTMLSELRRWQAAAPAVGGAVAAGLQAPSALTASAAAAAVATAWVASRRSLATAAFLAGFAILASALFVYYLYGVSVTAGLILAAVALMSIGAAAAWFRRAED